VIDCYSRAGSLAWLNIRFASEWSWVQIPPSPYNPRFKSPNPKNRPNFITKKNILSDDNIQIPIRQKTCEQIVDYKMRDLYKRAEKLAYWLKRIETDLQNSDKEDVLYLVRFMQDHERSSLWIIRCITILILVRKQLHRPFREATNSTFQHKYPLLILWMRYFRYSVTR
jgi:hypothetical protein